MACVCERCVAAYCCCARISRPRPAEERQSQAEVRKSPAEPFPCPVHSACSFCSRPLVKNGKNRPPDGPPERAVKRKLSRVTAWSTPGDGSVKRARENESFRLMIDSLKAEKNALFLELEEERNAAAVAATETLAMITRLQEEKAAVQMEASQYKRMVEERSRYDQEAIGMLNEILSRQEEEKLALSREVEMYRSSVGKISRYPNSEDEYMTPVESRNLIDSFSAAAPPSDESSPLRGSGRVHGRYEGGGHTSVQDKYEVGYRSTGRSEESEELFMQKYWRSSRSSASRELRRAYDRLGKAEEASSSGFLEEEQQRSARRNGELLELSRRLHALEAERGFLKQGYGGGGGGRNEDLEILEEISQQLRQIQALERKSDDGKEMSEASFVFSFKGFFSFNGLRKSLNSNINRLACMFIKHTEATGLDHHHVGLSHLLENSRKSPRAVPFITRGLKCESPAQLLNSHTIHRQNVQWPMDARGRSETAFGGWDY